MSCFITLHGADTTLHKKKQKKLGNSVQRTSSVPVLLVDLVVVGALADGRVEGKGLVQVAGLWGAQADKSRLKSQWSITLEWTSLQGVFAPCVNNQKEKRSSANVEGGEKEETVHSSSGGISRLFLRGQLMSYFYLVIQCGSWICFQTWSKHAASSCQNQTLHSTRASFLWHYWQSQSDDIVLPVYSGRERLRLKNSQKHQMSEAWNTLKMSTF